MDSAVSMLCVCALLSILVSGTHSNPDPQIVFGIEGEPVTFHFVHPPVVDYFLLFRVSADGGEKILLMCSRSEDAHHPEGQSPDCGYSFDVGLRAFFFRLNDVTASESGDYRVEGWTRRNKEHQRKFRLTVCAEGNEKPSCEQVTYDGNSAELFNLNLTKEDYSRSSLQLYRHNVLVLDTKASHEPLVEDLRGRLHVDSKTVLLSGITDATITEFSCALFSGAQCQSYHRKHLNANAKEIFAYEGESVTLPCSSKGHLLSTVYWDTPLGSVFVRDSQIGQWGEGINQSQTGNPSLTIPTLSKEQHSGWYQCVVGGRLVEVFSLYVCTKSTPSDVTFSNGGDVLLQHNISELDIAFVFGIHWYRHRIPEPQNLTTALNGESWQLPEDLRGRLTEDANNLKISKLTEEDSGLYTWRGFEDKCHEFKVCSEGTIQLVYADPSDWKNFPFHKVYGPLIGCALLGQVAVVICCLRRRRRRLREKISQRQQQHRLEEQQSAEEQERTEENR